MGSIKEPPEQRCESTVSVVIPVFNAMPDLRACLHSVLTELDRYGSGEVMAIDNGSTDGSYEFLTEHPSPRLRVLRLPRATIGELRNAGAREASGRILSFVDSDCVLQAGYYSSLARVLDGGETDADATGSRYALPDPSAWVERVWHDLHRGPDEGYVRYINAGNFALTRAAFEDVGGFREDLVSGEDAELGQRMTERGYRTLESRDVAAVHLGNPKTVRAFVRKQTWHGVGMFATLRRGSLDRPVVMLLLHLLLGAGGIAQLALSPFSLWPRVVILLVSLLAVPLATVVYRYLSGAGGGRPIRETVLYFFYYFARARALVIALRRRMGGRDPDASGRTSPDALAKSFRPR